ncbi:unnamed protein product [Schistosoma mattheei]|uniref:Uncharacterized protein n=1 Tax=Schistosoma mattheei TaxID=31246 RepID=A0A183P813_9TREM|nr:unnamed protein product [Schistosoma mattheei]
MSARIQKARLAFANLRHLWRRRDVRLSTKGRVYCAAARSVLLYGSKTWPDSISQCLLDGTQRTMKLCNLVAGTRQNSVPGVSGN